jgi:hypothetical protein
MEAVQCSCTSMAQCMRHAPLDVFTPSCLDMHGEYILTLDAHRYFLRMCPSNAEEMVKIGMLCYSSIFMFRDDLKLAILSHSSWTPSDPLNPPIFDIFVWELNSSLKKTKMLFVSAEKSKQDEVSQLFKSIYDGSQKSYPNGAMMVFIPISNLYNSSPAFRAKLQFNHEKYIGEETLFCIGGFKNLNNTVLLKNGKSISLRLLLKSILATEGMSRPQLFQQAEPNNGTTVTKDQDKELVLAHQETLEEEIRNVIAPGQESQVFLNDIVGIWFVSVNKNRNGINLSSFSSKNKEEVEYTAHINRIMNSPPKNTSSTILFGEGVSLPLPPKLPSTFIHKANRGIH